MVMVMVVVVVVVMVMVMVGWEGCVWVKRCGAKLIAWVSP